MYKEDTKPKKRDKERKRQTEKREGERDREIQEPEKITTSKCVFYVGVFDGYRIKEKELLYSDAVQ